MYYTQNSGKPCAFITKEKQRLKQFGQNVYLSNGSEFELELFNPTSNTVLAKIKFNVDLLSVKAHLHMRKMSPFLASSCRKTQGTAGKLRWENSYFFLNPAAFV